MAEKERLELSKLLHSSAFKAGALPLDYFSMELDNRFELLTYCLQNNCSTNWANPAYGLLTTLNPLYN